MGEKCGQAQSREQFVTVLRCAGGTQGRSCLDQRDLLLHLARINSEAPEVSDILLVLACPMA
jgi:hypothetical protein